MNYTAAAEQLARKLGRLLHCREDAAHLDFIISALTEHNPCYSTADIAQWLDALNHTEYFQVTEVPLAALSRWCFEPTTGDLRHETGRFFSIRGLHVRTNMGPIPEWSQPIIDQPGVGILGMLAKKIGGILYFLVQAKAEPGNIKSFQLSPTVQATRSNFMRVHGGKATPYLEYFLDPRSGSVLIDQLQSEQGARFYQKRNRNMIVRVPDDQEIPIGPHFRWVTLGQLIRLMTRDNAVNMDTRSVLSNISFDPEPKTSLEPIDPDAVAACMADSPLVGGAIRPLGVQLLCTAHSNTRGLLTTDEILRRMTQRKFSAVLTTRLVPLNEVGDWERTDREIRHKERKYFTVIGVRITAAQREVPDWDQPIIRQQDPGIAAFVMRSIDGVVHFLVQLKLECGNMDLLELAPTVQCITGSYTDGALPPLVRETLELRHLAIVQDTMQSEEGGRFFHESNRNLVCLADDRFSIEQPPHYLWLTLAQLKQFIQFNNFLNIEARSLVAGLALR